jgi:peptidoglycan-associated lipoprotein
MNLRFLSLLAGVLLLAACAGNTPESTTSTGTNTSTTPTTTNTAGQPGSREDFMKNVGDRVFFDYDKSDVKGEGRQVLQRQADWLKKYPNVTVTVEGHCDERGTREYNLALGQRGQEDAGRARRAGGPRLDHQLRQGAAGGRWIQRSRLGAEPPGRDRYQLIDTLSILFCRGACSFPRPIAEGAGALFSPKTSGSLTSFRLRTRLRPSTGLDKAALDRRF